jgi:uncharacterized membrane protein
MNEVVSTAPSADKSSQELESLRSITLVVYVLQALSFVFGLTAIVGIIINYIKREDAAGTVWANHFDWQIRTFWWGLTWCVLGFVLMFAFGLGLIVWGVAWIWMIYRVVKGWLKLTEGKPVFPA